MVKLHDLLEVIILLSSGTKADMALPMGILLFPMLVSVKYAFELMFS